MSGSGLKLYSRRPKATNLIRTERFFVRRQKTPESMKKVEEQNIEWAPETPEKIPPQRLHGKGVSEMKLGAQETASDDVAMKTPLSCANATSFEEAPACGFDGSIGLVLNSAGPIDLNQSVDSLIAASTDSMAAEDQAMDYAGSEFLSTGTEVLNGWDKGMSFMELLTGIRGNAAKQFDMSRDKLNQAESTFSTPVKKMNQSVDTEKRPNTKPKRKKHKPKVVVEGAQKCTPKPSTPKPATPRKAKENPSGKRKYTRKMKHPLDSECSSPGSTNVKLDYGEKSISSSGKGVRRALDFDSTIELVGKEAYKLWRQQLRFPKMCRKTRFKRRRKLNLFFWSDSMFVDVYTWCNTDGTKKRSRRSKSSKQPTSLLGLREANSSVERDFRRFSLKLLQQRRKRQPILKEAEKESGPNNTKLKGEIHHIIEKLQSLCVDDGGEKLMKKAHQGKGLKKKAQKRNKGKAQNSDKGALVPYQGSTKLVKKKQMAKVDLDSESLRVWNLLTDKDSKEKDNFGNEEHWQKERDIFKQRIDTFNTRNFLIQGDRGFRQWKGSVVDSIIGVFLTQNVTDHYSSSAFMSLAARFPFKKTCTSDALYCPDETACSQESVGSEMFQDKSTHDWEGNQYFVSEPALMDRHICPVSLCPIHLPVPKT